MVGVRCHGQGLEDLQSLFQVGCTDLGAGGVQVAFADAFQRESFIVRLASLAGPAQRIVVDAKAVCVVAGGDK